MPRANKTRGRREEKKRKRDADEENHEHLPSKQQRLGDITLDNHQEVFRIDATGEVKVDSTDAHDHSDPRTSYVNNETPFYGLLTEEEQTYYANVSNKLDANDFESEEDRRLFMVAVHRETIGKELKVASSQSSSRHLEKVIAMSEGPQLRNLIGRFLGNLVHLVQHRFASHVCETLFLRSSAFIGTRAQNEVVEEEDEKRSMEELLVLATEELQPYLGFLLADRFGSHVVRVLLLVISGEALDDESTKGVLARGKRQTMQRGVLGDTEYTMSKRAVPASFDRVLDTMITSSTSGLDTTSLRALATHPTGNPLLQLLLRLELTVYGKSKAKDGSSVLRRLLPEDTVQEGSESANFLHGMIYDPTGSHLVETIVQYAPGKTFKQVYRDFLQARIGTMARNDIASYVVGKILVRLSKDDLKAARDVILPEFPGLIERGRTSLIRVLIERSTAREANVEPLAEALCTSYGEEHPSFLLKMLKLDAEPEELRLEKSGAAGQDKQAITTRAVNLHGALLAQVMLHAQPVVSNLIYDSLAALPNDLLFLLAKDSAASRVLQLAVTSPTSTPQYRRKLIPRFYGHMVELAIDPAGSHLADALWDGTNGAHFMKERLAKELTDQESLLRASRHGRSVWKNWYMDLHSRKPQEWQNKAKGYKDTPTETVTAGAMSAIELARENYGQKKARELHVRRANTTATNSRQRPVALTMRG